MFNNCTQYFNNKKHKRTRSSQFKRITTNYNYNHFTFSNPLVSENCVDWELVTQGPTQAYHCCCIINSNIYTHGGISDKSSSIPLNKLFIYDFDTLIWTDITDENSPYLSHHSSIVLSNRYFVLIGGWNGKRRCSDVHVFDTIKRIWMHPTTSGFPVGSGLSGHTSTLLRNGSIAVLGREGGLRLQNRTGNSFLLSGDIVSGFKYHENPVGLSSRSGHTTLVIDNLLLVCGGRDDKPIEGYPGYKRGYKQCSYLTYLSGYLDRAEKQSKIPIRRYHTALEGDNMMFLYGGESFSGRSLTEPTGDIFLITFKPTFDCFKLASSVIARKGHVLMYTDNAIYMHGGIIPKYNVSGSLFKLKRLK